ncbi:putative bifunctional diguanylate cyclase/phosphodiesterase [Klenkia brasiliensis]|uniref:Diguanylate cyclase (GGDEF) domain-containing protein n=1 Tax=Klenkia brasiliensis TaxID=333142 RepID=A0A1G7Q610_9ACTN|nr:bifunctional diguanylate cyclase/phosphodiesterase [Klenkia brasiliensis]SDF93992.1 diguanylate cyclase (GGDEF) domain-containing protein [Klenkia brasiliensis]
MPERRAWTTAVPRPTRWAFGLLLVAAVVRLLVPAGTTSELLYLLVVTGAAVLAWGAVLGGSRAGAWTAAGVTLSALGDWVWQVLTWRGAPTDVSVADIAYLLSYVAVGMGLRRVLARTVEGSRVDRLVDTAAVFLFVLHLEYVVVLQHSIGAAGLPSLDRVVMAGYPVLDAWLVALVARLFFARSSLRVEAGLVATGASAWFLADMGYLFAAGDSTVLDTGWTIGSLALAGSLWAAGAGRSGPDPSPRVALPVSRAQLAVTLAPLAVPGVVAVVGRLDGSAVDPLPGVAVTLTMLVLAFLRADRLSHQQAELRQALELRARRSSALAVDAADALVVVDRDGAPLRGPGLPDASPTWSGVGRTDPAGRQAVLDRALLHPGHPEVVELPGALGTWVEVRVVDRTADPDLAGLVVTMQDVTERRRVQDELAHQAFHDVLTGAANRALFDDRITHALARSARTGVDPTLLSMDLDGFKNVNDTLGHPAGDALLQLVAERLTAHVRPGDTVARLGGDEFAVLLDGQAPDTGGDHLAVAERLLARLSLPYEVAGRTVRVGVSIGLVTATPDGECTPTTLLRDADAALYAAKAAGKGRVLVFEPRMRADLLLRTRLTADLPGALAAGQLRVVYQPVVDLGTGQLEGFEALLRWQHPVLGDVAPTTFVPIAEETGHIEAIGAWVLREACTAAAAWWAGTGPGPGIAVNLSVRQLRSDDVVTQVAGALADSGLPPHALCLELTETALVLDTDQATRTLHALRDLGVRLAVDDFGTGYSSMAHLRHFPVDVLKIDRSFISGMDPDGPPSTVVRGLLELARVMGLDVVAEGVESAHQREQLQAQGCSSAQGWLFSAAVERDVADQQVAAARIAAGAAGAQA